MAASASEGGCEGQSACNALRAAPMLSQVLPSWQRAPSDLRCLGGRLLSSLTSGPPQGPASHCGAGPPCPHLKEDELEVQCSANTKCHIAWLDR